MLALLLAIAPSSISSIVAQTKGEVSPLTIPKRRLAESAVVAPPELPQSADSIEPVTVEFTVTRRGASGSNSVVRHKATRTGDRIHLVSGDRSEWLFERNTVDHRRVSATLVEHADKAIVVYDETDLRTVLGIRGWADVLTLGLDPGTLSGYKKAADVRTLAGIRFTRYEGSSSPDKNTDVWWSAEQALPSEFALSDSGSVTRFSLERVELRAESSLLQPAQRRFPAYRVVAYADWLEKH